LSFCKRADLLSLEKIGIDSTKIRFAKKSSLNSMDVSSNYPKSNQQDKIEFCIETGNC
jgi:hypothetical protein